MMPIQQSIKLSPYMGLYDLIVPKDNMLRQLNDLVDFTSRRNPRNAIK
ncbi:hypothetical protein J7I80_07660 [Bacillus sp. ISL-41]|nr:hypothetical protein [Bacillus sp. ISL-41]